MKYIVTKEFVSGHLAGVTVREKTSVSFVVGKVYIPCAGGSSYKIVSLERA